MKVSSLKLRKKNPRKIEPAAMQKLKESIQRDPEFMVLRPIVVDAAMVALGGNQRLKAIVELGMTEIPDTWVVQAADLTQEQQERFILVDNAPDGMSGVWDMEMLAKEFQAPLLESLGFDMAELQAPGDGDNAGGSDPDEVPEAPGVPVTQRGDVWVCGRHRVMCGDSTSAEDVGRLMGGGQAGIMVTDPPYGVEYDAGWRDEAAKTCPSMGKRKDTAKGKVSNDDRSDWSEAWALFPGDVAYVWHAMKTQHSVATSLIDSGIEIRSEIVWAKSALIISQGHYHPQHESCFYAVRKGATASWTGDRKQTTLWQIDKPQKSETGHSTQKPVECMERPLRNHNFDSVYDPFLGSGTTLIAAEKTNRTCYGMEISEAYCDIICQRYYNFTGELPVLEATGEPFSLPDEESGGGG